MRKQQALKYFKNITERFRTISAILQYFQGIFLKYCLNISVLYIYKFHLLTINERRLFRFVAILRKNFTAYEY